jgi:hypothetical protein
MEPKNSATIKHTSRTVLPVNYMACFTLVSLFSYTYPAVYTINIQIFLIAGHVVTILRLVCYMYIVAHHNYKLRVEWNKSPALHTMCIWS